MTGPTGPTGETGPTGIMGQTGPTGSIGIQAFAQIRATNSQFVPSGMTGSSILFDADDYLNDVTHVANSSQIVIDIDGVYAISYSIELFGAQSDVDIWIKKNGTDILSSLRRTTLQNVNDFRTVSCTLLNSAVATDYFEIWQSSLSTNAGIYGATGLVDPDRPDISSAILTLHKISN